MRKCPEKREENCRGVSLRGSSGPVSGILGLPTPNVCVWSTVTPVADTCREFPCTRSQAGVRGEPGLSPALKGPACRLEEWLPPWVTTAADAQVILIHARKKTASLRWLLRSEAGGLGCGCNLHSYALVQREGQALIFRVVAKGKRDKTLHIHCWD